MPRDYLWMYPGVLLTLLFVVLAACLVPLVAPGRRLLAAIGVLFVVMGATVIVVDYGIQLTVLHPAFLAGEMDGLSALSQYNPHGVFIALENAGYALLGVAFLLLGGALTQGVSRIERAIRWVFTVGGLAVPKGGHDSWMVLTGFHGSHELVHPRVLIPDAPTLEQLLVRPAPGHRDTHSEPHH